MTTPLLPFLFVGLGGCAGALLRYSLTLGLQNVSLTLPYGTLSANLAGCFVIGLIVQLSALTDAISTETRLLLATGFCGGFTTLSSLIYELSQLLEDSEYFYASVYFAATFIGALLSFYLGTTLVRLWLRF